MKQTINEMAENWFSKLPSARHARGEIKESFLIAYKDGYADAQRWHYPSKGDKPENKEMVFLYYRDADDCKQFAFGYMKYGFWYTTSGCIDDDEEVIAWQYLPEPPKETN